MKTSAGRPSGWTKHQCAAATDSQLWEALRRLRDASQERSLTIDQQGRIWTKVGRIEKALLDRGISWREIKGVAK